MGCDLLIITPLFFGDGSGAPVYYRTLARELMARGYDVAVISDGERGDFEGTYHAVLPRWAGRNKNKLKEYVLYSYQNLMYARLPGIIKSESPTSVLVHSGFYNHPGVFQYVMAMTMRSSSGPRYLADARDRLLPKGRVRSLEKYDKVIACSENVKRHLVSGGLSGSKVEMIPVVQDRIDPRSLNTGLILGKFGLESGRYILYVGAVKEAKGVDLLLRAYKKFVRNEIGDVPFVIVGLLKTNSRTVRDLLASEGVRYLGSLARSESLALMNGSALCVNLSPSEGMPRVSLEALTLKKPVLLPPNIPEFDVNAPGLVMSSTDTEVIGKRIVEVYRKGTTASYPVEDHLPDAVIPRYEKVLGLRGGGQRKSVRG